MDYEPFSTTFTISVPIFFCRLFSYAAEENKRIHIYQQRDEKPVINNREYLVALSLNFALRSLPSYQTKNRLKTFIYGFSGNRALCSF